MITPDDTTPQNDPEQIDDQRSQQDIQSDGIDPVPPSEEDQAAAEIDHLQQADRASQSSFTLHVDGDAVSGEQQHNQQAEDTRS